MTRKPAAPLIPHHELVLTLAFAGRQYRKPRPHWVEYTAHLLAMAVSSFEWLLVRLGEGEFELARLQWRDYRAMVAIFYDALMKRTSISGLPSEQEELPI